MLVFLKSIVLDNFIFSSEDEKDVDAGWTDMTLQKGHEKVKETLRGMAIYWRIAEHGGRRIEKKKSGPDYDTMYGSS